MCPKKIRPSRQIAPKILEEVEKVSSFLLNGNPDEKLLVIRVKGMGVESKHWNPLFTFNLHLSCTC